MPAVPCITGCDLDPPDASNTPRLVVTTKNVSRHCPTGTKSPPGENDWSRLGRKTRIYSLDAAFSLCSERNIFEKPQQTLPFNVHWPGMGHTPMLDCKRPWDGASAIFSFSRRARLCEGRRRMEVVVCSICMTGFHRRDQVSFQSSLNR